MLQKPFAYRSRGNRIPSLSAVMKQVAEEDGCHELARCYEEKREGAKDLPWWEKVGGDGVSDP